MVKVNSDIKFGFYLGVGLIVASLAVALIQLLVLRVAQRNG